MVFSTVPGGKPTPLDAFDCGSRSTSRVGRSAAARLAARLTAVVVLPTPPFWFAMAMMLGRAIESVDPIQARTRARQPALYIVPSRLGRRERRGGLAAYRNAR